MVYRKKKYTSPGGSHRKKERFWSKILTWLPQMRGRRRGSLVQPPIGLAGVPAPPKPKKKNLSPAKVLMVFIAVALSLAAWGTVHLVNTLNIFRVTDLRLAGARFITERQVLELAGLRQGINLITFNTSEAEKKIATHPWVAEARIRKQWPSGVLVQVRVDPDRGRGAAHLDGRGGCAGAAPGPDACLSADRDSSSLRWQTPLAMHRP